MPHRPTSPPAPLAALALLLAACTAPPPPALGPGGVATAPAITAGDLRARVGVLAADSMEGRGTGTAGEARAARYLVREAVRLGLRPIGATGYLHPVPLVRRYVDADVKHVARGGPVITAGDVVPVSGILGLPASSRLRGGGPLLYAGFLFDPSVAADELRLDQLRDAVVILRPGRAPGVSSSAPPRLPLAALLSPSSPAAAVLIVEDDGARGVWDFAADAGREGVVELAEGPERPGPAFFLVRPSAVDALVGSGVGEGRAPRADLGRLDFEVRQRTVALQGQNVAAVLPGSDPSLAGEYVALGAHYDHVGIGEPVAGDSIYNGADDDASGSAALLEIAERFAAAGERPRRSLLFVWHSAEEAGLLGSERFTDHPPLPRDAIVAQLNLDMVGRNGPDSLFVVGSRRLSTQLGTLVEEVNRGRPEPFNFDYSYDQPGHPEQVYCRSDHYNYARFGIPVAFFTTGLHDDYHRPSDEAARVDFRKLARVAGLVGDVARALADRADRPAVDRPVPPPTARCTG